MNVYTSSMINVMYLQVLSTTVSRALEVFCGEETTETATFSLMFDRFFACFNFSSSLEMPSSSSKDFRLQVTLLPIYLYHKVREYFVYRDGHGLGSMAIHLAHHCFSFNMRWI